MINKNLNKNDFLNHVSLSIYYLSKLSVKISKNKSFTKLIIFFIAFFSNILKIYLLFQQFILSINICLSINIHTFLREIIISRFVSGIVNTYTS